MNIYVGNLNYEVQDHDLENLFSEYGEVMSVNIITDKFSGRSKGFAFVEMSNTDDGQNAIDSLNGELFKNRKMVVNEARPRRN